MVRIYWLVSCWSVNHGEMSYLVEKLQPISRSTALRWWIICLGPVLWGVRMFGIREKLGGWQLSSDSPASLEGGYLNT